MRYVSLEDLDHSGAGWGQHFWVVATHKVGPPSHLALLAKKQAEREVARLNHLHGLAGPYIG